MGLVYLSVVDSQLPVIHTSRAVHPIYPRKEHRTEQVHEESNHSVVGFCFSGRI